MFKRFIFGAVQNIVFSSYAAAMCSGSRAYASESAGPSE